MAEHLVASTRGRVDFMADSEAVGWLWQRLVTEIGLVLACVFMPDHIHLVVPPGHEASFRRVLRSFHRRYGVRFDLLEPQVCNSPAIATRTVRYAILNPVRAGLVECPWAWPFSTLRDVAGLVGSPWVEAGALAARLRLPRGQLLRRITETADLRPELPSSGAPLLVSLDAALGACASALHIAPSEVWTRPSHTRLLTQVLRHHMPTATAQLAELLEIDPTTLRRRCRDPHPALPAALRCLADPRLH